MFSCIGLILLLIGVVSPHWYTGTIGQTFDDGLNNLPDKREEDVANIGAIGVVHGVFLPAVAVSIVSFHAGSETRAAISMLSLSLAVGLASNVLLLLILVKKRFPAIANVTSLVGHFVAGARTAWFAVVYRRLRVCFNDVVNTGKVYVSLANFTGCLGLIGHVLGARNLPESYSVSYYHGNFPPQVNYLGWSAQVTLAGYFHPSIMLL